MKMKKNFEIISPHKIAVVLLIEKYCQFRPRYWIPRMSCGIDTYDSNYNDNFTPKERRAACFVITKLIEETEYKLSELMLLLESSDIPPQLLTNFKNGLQEMYTNGIDSLLTLFESIDKFCLVMDSYRSENYPCLWSSVVGLYLRQISLLFIKLGFSQVTNVYQKFLLYYDETYSTEKLMTVKQEEKCAMETDDIIEDTDIEQDENEMSLDLTSCSNEVMSLTTPAISSNLPSVTSIMPELKNLSVDESKSKEGSLQQAELFIARQITLLECNESAALSPLQLQNNIRKLLDHNQAVAQAHFLSYLNCLRVKELPGAIHSLVLSYDSRVGSVHQSASEDPSKMVKYAALNMAALHAQFGHTKVALMALQEAIRLAQESNDNVCLQHALTWLYTLSPDHKASLIKKSLAKSDQMSLNYIKWLGLLNYTKLLAKSSVAPATLIQNVLAACNTGGDNRSWGHIGLWSVLAAIWTTWGCSTMSSLCSQLLLHITPSIPNVPYASYANSSACTALCNIALGLADMGDYDEAMEVIIHTNKLFPPSHSQSKYCQFTESHIRLVDLIHQGCWTAADNVIRSLATSYPLHAKLKRCVLATFKGESIAAIKNLQELLNNPEVQELHELYTQCLLVKAEALIAGGNCGSALSVLVEAYTTAETHHLVYLAALVKLHLSAVQLELGLISEAQASLSMGLDVVLSGGNIYDQARAKLLSIKLKIRSTKNVQKEKIIKVESSKLKYVRKLFQKIRAHHRIRDTLYLEARLNHETGSIEDRNRCAYEYRQFEQQHPCQSFHPYNYIF